MTLQHRVQGPQSRGAGGELIGTTLSDPRALKRRRPRDRRLGAGGPARRPTTSKSWSAPGSPRQIVKLPIGPIAGCCLPPRTVHNHIEAAKTEFNMPKRLTAALG